MCQNCKQLCPISACWNLMWIESVFYMTKSTWGFTTNWKNFWILFMMGWCSFYWDLKIPKSTEYFNLLRGIKNFSQASRKLTKIFTKNTWSHLGDELRSHQLYVRIKNSLKLPHRFPQEFLLNPMKPAEFRID